MMPLDEKDLQLLAEVLPNVSAQLRSSMANVFAAANRLAPAEAREADPMLDKNAAILARNKGFPNRKRLTLIWKPCTMA
mgnify:CR=1 FL=1